MSHRFFGLLLVICATIIEAFGQICLKQSALRDKDLRKYLWLAFGLSVLALEAVVWTTVLHVLDVSIAYPMGSLTFVMVAILSKIFLGEAITRKRWLGILFILCGTAMVGA